MTGNCILFAAINLSSQDIEHKRVLEAGSLNVNGSLRPIIEKYGPREYIGVDISRGPGVDVCCDVLELESYFGRNSFDLVVSTELLEHVRNWREAVRNIKAVCKPGGAILITTRSAGFAYHGFPSDYWRYELKDMDCIFSDFKVVKLENDPAKGVFIKCLKPENFVENNIADYSLYSIVGGRRMKELDDNALYRWKARLIGLREALRYHSHKAIDMLLLSK